ncbi:MAG: PA4780 family RIO1-like protein kinase [Myxococcota bacterium]
MKAPESLETLIEYGIIQEVVRPLMSGKEAQVFIVVAGGEECVAKVYKEATQRTFKHRVEYTEGRKTRNSRDQRAMNKRSQHGRKQDEAAWRSTEVDMIYRLRDAGVRVPEPINFVEGVLVMELVKDAQGGAAPRLGDLNFSAAEAKLIYDRLMREVVRMLCAGIVHGDLSDFNVLMSADGPVVIDFPQAIDPTHNPNGEKLLLRDVENLHRFLARFAPEETIRPYGQEIWKLYQKNKLRPDTELSGVYVAPAGKVDTTELMGLIEDAGRDAERRRSGPKLDEDDDAEFEAARDALGSKPATFRKVVDFTKDRKPRPSSRKPGNAPRADSEKGAPRRRNRRGRGGDGSRDAGNGGRGKTAAKAQDSSNGSRSRNAPNGPRSDRAASASGAPKTPPRGPRAMMEGRSGTSNAEAKKEGAGSERASGASQSPSPNPRRRNRRRRGAGKGAGGEASRSEGSPNRSKATPPSGPAKSQKPQSKTSGQRGARGPGSGASEANSDQPARRRRRRRPRNKPDAE